MFRERRLRCGDGRVGGAGMGGVRGKWLGVGTWVVGIEGEIWVGPGARASSLDILLPDRAGGLVGLGLLGSPPKRHFVGL